MTTHEFIHMLIAKDMTCFIKNIIKIPALDLQRDQFYFCEDDNDKSINHWYLVRSNTFADIENKLLDHEISYFKWEGELWIGLTNPLKNNQKLRDLYEDYLMS